MSKPFNCDDVTLDNWGGFKPVRRKRTAHACQMHEAFQVTVPRGMATGRDDYIMTGEPGDYLVIGAHGEKSIVEREKFEANWVEIKKSIAKVQAVYDGGTGFVISALPGSDIGVAVGNKKYHVASSPTFRGALEALVELAGNLGRETDDV